ncbi:head-tail connector protein [Jannaschia pohangensis]|uniref:Uncharacterized protein n=1 Tax=Jannaschia pohangensis TaxID=390807 RepID=A0A1I3HSU6_9RHOB|nr:hypothetical protein [Jannaschia pohangensis]SFI38637.1 phage conserved hypothetical protein, phiE125 gp8 family [Jannaschia pohangensis]
MAIRVQDGQAIADEALPLAELAAQMRLPDGFESVPGMAERLRLRLRSAIAAVERRLGKALIAREFTLIGVSEGGQKVSLPIAPVEAVLSSEADHSGTTETLGAASVDDDGYRPVAKLARSVARGDRLTLVVQAGYGPWTAVPPDLRQAVLLVADAMETDHGKVPEAAEALLAPHRLLRLGGQG